MATAPSKLTHPKDPPRKQVFLLTCMDLRLTDDTAAFMNGLNLENRYDHVTLAGSAMGARLLGTPVPGTEVICPWKAIFFHHLTAAINVLHRDVSDIMIIEHLDCGAYRELHPDPAVRAKYNKLSKIDMQRLVPTHQKEAHAFAREVEDFCALQSQTARTELQAARAQLASHLHDAEAAVKRILELEAQSKAWANINLRCFIMDLQGGVQKF